ncbi:MAG: hypothetical protein PHS79_01270 [Patescibacteria group bacterium]|nr:hypothetical protein [Patescibacteria group bacterium]
MYYFLRWLGNHKNVDVISGGKHPTKVTCRQSGETYPLPLGHSFLNKHIVKDFMEWLVKNEICSEQEFDERI